MARKLVLAIALVCAVAFGLMSVSAQAAAAQSAGSAGCSASNTPVHPGRDITLSLQIGDVMRSYLLHLPRSYRAHVATPLVLAFHGHNNTGSILESATGFSRLSDRYGFIIAYPQGVIGPDGQTGWNTGRTSGPRIDPTTDDLAFVDALTSHLEATLCINTARIYATGFSNGGGFVAILACERASTFTAVGIVAGDYYPQVEGCHPSRPIPLLEVHGTGDEINPYGGSTTLGYPSVTDWLAAWAARDGCTVGPRILSHTRAGVTKEEWSACAGGVLVIHDQIAGMGHMWPNGNRASDYFNATTNVWAFFAHH